MKDEKQIEEMALIICGFKDCTSCISRMGLRKCGAKAYAERFYNAGYRKQKEGEWISLESSIGLYACSLCDHRILRAKCNYCPNCGAKMKGGA